MSETIENMVETALNDPLTASTAPEGPHGALVMTDYLSDYNVPVFDENGNIVMLIGRYSSSQKQAAYRVVAVDDDHADTLELIFPKYEMVPVELSDLTETERAALDLLSGEAKSLTFDELKKKLNIGDDVTSTYLADKNFDPRTDTGIPVISDNEANTAIRESNLSERIARRLLGQLDSIADLKSYLAEIGPKMSDIDSLTDEEVASFNETLRLFKEVITDTGLDSAALDPRTDTGMNLETLDPRTDTNLMAILDSYIAALDEKEAKTAGTTVADPDGPTIATDYIYGPGFIVTDISTNPVMEKIMSKIRLTAFAVKDYGEGWSIIRTGDFNGNGTTDVLVANPTAASDTVGLIGYWENNEDWTLIGGYSPEWSVIATADFDGNGTTDILWRNSFVGDDGNTYNAYCTWIVDNDANWRMVSASDAAEWDFLCTGDFDGDGTKDIAMINATGVVDVWRVVDGVLQSDSVLSVVDTSAWEFFSVGDFDDDGTDDIAWRSADGTTYGYWQIRDGQLAAWEASSAPTTVFVINTTIPGGEYLDQGATLA